MKSQTRRNQMKRWKRINLKCNMGYSLLPSIFLLHRWMGSYSAVILVDIKLN